MAPDLRRYVLMGVSAAVGIGGLAVASSSGSGSAYHLGIGIFILAVLWAFSLVRQHIDAETHGEVTEARSFDSSRFVPQSQLGPWFALVGASAVALLGLIFAAGGRVGSLGYDLGLAIFVLAVLYIFLVIKVLIDRSVR